MKTKNHVPFGKQLLRALLGLVVALGYGTFWYGLCKTIPYMIVLGALSLAIGIFHLVKAFCHLKAISSRYFRY